MSLFHYFNVLLCALAVNWFPSADSRSHAVIGHFSTINYCRFVVLQTFVSRLRHVICKFVKILRLKLLNWILWKIGRVYVVCESFGVASLTNCSCKINLPWLNSRADSSTQRWHCGRFLLWVRPVRRSSLCLWKERKKIVKFEMIKLNQMLKFIIEFIKC